MLSSKKRKVDSGLDVSLKGKRARNHTRNPYQEPLDLHELSKARGGALSRFVTRSAGGELKFAWKSAEAMRMLTEVLLERDFGVEVKCHPGRLCPPLPNRLNYLYWLDDLLEHWSLEEQRVHVLDVGVGSNAIYPILGNKQFGWRFTGSDIDGESLEWARNHVISKESEEDISLIKTDECTAAQEIFSSGDSDSSAELFLSLQKYILGESSLEICRGPIRKALSRMGTEFAAAVTAQEAHWSGNRGSLLAASTSTSAPALAAVMTNPPFYNLSEPIKANHHSVCTGSITEMRTSGGELAFLGAMVLDSLVMRGTVRWYTCMVGKKASLGLLRGLLRACGVPVTHCTRFKQGRTMRFGLAWSFHHDRRPLAIYSPIKKNRAAAGKVVLSRRKILDTMMPSEMGEADAGAEALTLERLALRRVRAAVKSVEDLAPSLVCTVKEGQGQGQDQGQGGDCGSATTEDRGGHGSDSDSDSDEMFGVDRDDGDQEEEEEM